MLSSPLSRKRLSLTAAALSLFFILAACQRDSGKPPFSPQDSLKMLKIAEGYKIEPFASEPDVVSPAAMDIDEDGRIYVAEDRGYPLDVEGKVGRIKMLEDTNGDGIPDKTTIFADNLTLPNGVMRWKKGILVTDAPDVWYLEDTNGDGKADIKKKVLTGFPLTNPQHTVNGAVYGLDNWIYLAHENPTTAIIFKDKFGDRGTDLSFVEKPEVKLTERGRSVRFRPDTFQIEALAGTSQFGHGFDDFGRHFVLNNTYHARFEALEARYLKRNPDLPVVTVIEDISDHGSPSKVFPIIPKTRFEMLTNVGEFTSACGLTFWRGGVFVAEPAHNLAHRDVYSPKGVSFQAHRDKEGVEFIASRDPWFRPVNFYAAPDGSLYMLDYYRLVIEHPEWMATETYGSKDLTAGIDRGRIYRITPTQGFTPGPKPQLSKASSAELVQLLASDNPWQRRTAQRLLVDRKAADAAAALASMAASHASPVARVHALWTLEGLGKLENSLVEKALADAEPGVRENAIKLAEPRLASAPALTAKLLSMTTDADARVRFQLLSTLGFVSTPQARDARDKLLTANFDDRWTQLAALSTSPEEASRLFAMAAGKAGPASFFQQAASVIGARHKPAEMQSLIATVNKANTGAWRPAALEGLATGLKGKNAPLPADLEAALLRIFAGPDPALRRAGLHVIEASGLSKSADAQAAVAKAIQTAKDDSADAELRADSLALTALSDPASRRALFEELANSKQPEPVQIAALHALGMIPGEQTGTFVIRNWRSFTGKARLEAADAVYRDPERLPLVVAALKSGDIQPWTLQFRHRSRLIMHRDPAIRAAVRPLFEGSADERGKVVAQYQAALEKSPNPGKGQQVFQNICSKCHRMNGGKGADVGPDLATVRNQPKQALLVDILNPSKSISQGFEAYVVETANGGSLDGVLGPQTTTTLTLRHEEGKEDVIQRKDIKSMYVTNLSAMPGDLEKQIDVQQMADLLEYLKSGS